MTDTVERFSNRVDAGVCGRPETSASTYRSKRVGASATRRSYAAIALPRLAYTRLTSSCRAAGMRAHAARHAVSATGPARSGSPSSRGSGPKTASYSAR
jgi:hypothetical protein